MTPKVNTTPRNNPPILVLNVLADPDLDPGFSYSSSSDSSDSTDNEYYKRIRHAKNYKNKLRSKTRFNDTIRKCAKLTSKLLKAVQKSRVIKFKLDDDPLQHRVYFISFTNSLKNYLSQFKDTFMLPIEYP